MINTTLATSNHENNYNPFQLQLPLDVSTIIPKDDLVYTFVEILEGVDFTKYLISHQPHGNKKYDPIDLFKTVLFGFGDNERTLRQIEQACKVDIRYMWLSQESRPCFMTIQRFINDYLIGTVEDIFYDINKYLIEKNSIDMTKLYIDGTKIEAYARKTSFVWKKSVFKYQQKLYLKITDTLAVMNSMIPAVDMFIPKGKYTPREVIVYIDYLSLLIQKYDVWFVHGKGSSTLL